MRIENHRLVSDSRLVDLTHKWAPDRHVSLRPTHIIIHYDVCHSMAENTRALFGSGLSYHVAVDGFDHDGRPVEVRQYVPFDLRAVHAKGWNDKAIGLCIVNPGPLIPDAYGVLRTVHGRAWDPDDALKCEHRSGLGPQNWEHWAAYSHEERDTVIELCGLILEACPTIHTICGHDYVAPGEKYDPGPAADDAIMAPLRAAFPSIHVPEVQAA